MRTHVCICTCLQCHVCQRDEIARAYASKVREARAIHIMQIVFSDDCRGQSVAAAKRGLCALNVHVTLLTVQIEL